MPLPPAVERLAGTRQFWADYFWQTNAGLDAYPDLRDCQIEVPVGDGYALSLALDAGLGGFDLHFKTPSGETHHLGWDDQAHWHPHALRWAELDTICRAAALVDPQLSHPGLPLLLLYRFAPLCVGDEPETILPLLVEAWQRLGLFTPKELAPFLERIDRREVGFEWGQDAKGHWRLTQPGVDTFRRCLYTLRGEKSADFPDAAWGQLLAAAERTLAKPDGAIPPAMTAFAETGKFAPAGELAKELAAAGHIRHAAALGDNPGPIRACWVVESLLGLPLGSLVRKHAPTPPRLRRTHSYRLTIPFTDAVRPLPAPAARVISLVLDAVLDALHLGGAKVCSSSSSVGTDGRTVPQDTTICISVLDDEPTGLAVIRQVLWWLGAPTTVTLTDGWFTRLPFELDTPPEPNAPLYLQLARMSVVTWRAPSRGGSSHRIDQPPLLPEARAAALEPLCATEAVGPDEDGWYSLTPPDGGSVRVCGRGIDDPDFSSVVLVVERLSPGVSAFLHRLMSEGNLHLLPVAATASPDEASAFPAPWPKLTVTPTPAELHAILSAGPFARWSSAVPDGS